MVICPFQVCTILVLTIYIYIYISYVQNNLSLKEETSLNPSHHHKAETKFLHPRDIIMMLKKTRQKQRKQV
jgi:hypothetical protein